MKLPLPTNADCYKLHYRHTLIDNAESHKGEAVVSVEADGSWAAIAVCGEDGVSVAEVTVELYEGKLVARIWNEQDQGNDPTASVELCKNPVKGGAHDRCEECDKLIVDCDGNKEPHEQGPDTGMSCPDGAFICRACFDAGAH